MNANERWPWLSILAVCLVAPVAVGQTNSFSQLTPDQFHAAIEQFDSNLAGMTDLQIQSALALKRERERERERALEFARP